MIETGSDFSGVGAFEQALIRLGIDYKTVFACEMDKYARKTYIENYGTASDLEIVNSKTHDKICDMMMRIANGVAEGSPEFFKSAENLAKSFSFYYPLNVYNREIPKKPLGIYIPTPPCQSFSLAGKRKGEDSVNGVLFYNSHEFIQENKPRFFIFENVKGLLSDAKGRTFQIWLDMLGGKSVNGNPAIFPREDATPYHIYHQVLNAKHYGVPQNRERVFIIGIRDDEDNTFNFPKEQYLTKRLKDVLENEVDQKYYLSDKMINYLHQRSDNFNNGKVNYKDENDTASCITRSSSSLDISDNIIKVGNTNPSGNGMNGNVFDAEGISPTLSTNKGEGIKVKSATKKGYEIATENDSINLSQPNSETRRGRVGKEVAQTLDTACNKAVIDTGIRRLTPRECFRLMDFPDSFKMPCSNSQMYKQAGNSIVVNVLAEIINKLNLTKNK